MPSVKVLTEWGGASRFVDKQEYEATMPLYALQMDVDNAVAKLATKEELSTATEVKKSDVEPVVRTLLQELPNPLQRIVHPQSHSIVRVFPDDYVLGNNAVRDTTYGGGQINTATTNKHSAWSIRAKYFPVTVGRTYQYSVRFNARTAGTIELVPYWGTTAANAEGANYHSNAPYAVTASVNVGMNIVHMNIPVLTGRVPSGVTHVTAYAYFYGGATGHFTADLTEIRAV